MPDLVARYRLAACVDDTAQAAGGVVVGGLVVLRVECSDKIAKQIEQDPSAVILWQE